jgi:hypothetical protein
MSVTAINSAAIAEARLEKIQDLGCGVDDGAAAVAGVTGVVAVVAAVVAVVAGIVPVAAGGSVAARVVPPRE